VRNRKVEDLNADICSRNHLAIWRLLPRLLREERAGERVGRLQIIHEWIPYAGTAEPARR
jgi:hypothetical protein